MLIALISLYFVIPKSQLDIFFDPEKSTSDFTVLNLGNQPIKNVKISYSLDCQDLVFSPKYISTEVPILTESNGQQPFYNHRLDNLTQEILENSYQSRAICKNEANREMFIPFSRFVINSPYDNPENLNFSKELSYNFTVWYCDSCNMGISVTSDNENKNQVYKFINPIKINIKIFCLDLPKTVECVMEFKHEGPGDIHAINDFFKVDYNDTGVFIRIEPGERKIAS